MDQTTFLYELSYNVNSSALNIDSQCSALDEAQSVAGN